MGNCMDRDLLIELKTINSEILRRLEVIDRQIVPRIEYEAKVKELEKLHITNQKDIEELQTELKNMIWKLGGVLGSLQLIIAIVMFMLTQRLGV